MKFLSSIFSIFFKFNKNPVSTDMPFLSLPHPDDSRHGQIFRSNIHLLGRKFVMDGKHQKYELGTDLVERKNNPLQDKLTSKPIGFINIYELTHMTIFFCYTV